MNKTNGEIALQYWICESCNLVHPVISMEVRRVEAGKGSWTVAGGGSVDHPACWSCGAICREVAMRLPAELDGAPCPSCGKAVEFRYRLTLVQTGEGAFEFSAAVSCPSCTHESAIKKVLASLHIVKKVKIGPTGAEFEFNTG